MKRIKYFIIIFSAVLLTVPFFSVFAQSYGLNETVSTGNLKEAFMVSEVDNETAEQFLSTRVGNVLAMILSFLGVLFLILIIVGGIRWMTAAGNQDKVKKAKDMIISAIIGLVIVFSAYAITAFIGSALTS
ncbi:hypothetical protein EOL94_03210 [bacterium]|nr:hypothetical protein [bacterium]